MLGNGVLGEGHHQIISPLSSAFLKLIMKNTIRDGGSTATFQALANPTLKAVLQENLAVLIIRLTNVICMIWQVLANICKGWKIFAVGGKYLQGVENICNWCKIFVIGGKYLQGVTNIRNWWHIFARDGKY